jgi:peptidoglycan hydrolase-like protein with peptidoglycan-binding domain
MTYRYDYQQCPTHRRRYCLDPGCRTQRTRGSSGVGGTATPPTDEELATPPGGIRADRVEDELPRDVILSDPEIAEADRRLNLSGVPEWGWWGIAAILAACTLITLLGVAGVGPAASPKAHAAERAATARTASATGTLRLGPQAVSVSVSVSGSRSGVPHPCVVNNGPHPIAVVQYSITDARHTLAVRDRILAKAGDAYCWAKGSVTLPARLYVMAVDQRNGAGGKLTLTVRPVDGARAAPAPKRHPAPPHRVVGITARTAAVQRAVGVTPDGIWGPNTEAAVDRVQSAAYMHYGAMPGTVRRVQYALGVPVDGLWGPWTNSAWFIARMNARS